MVVSLEHERALWGAGAGVVAGVDEVGRGALAGPVAVGLVALAPCEGWPEGLADSKELPPARRESIAAALAEFGVARAVGEASNAEVDEYGIVGALRLAGHRALAAVLRAGVSVDVILLDGSHDWFTPVSLDLFGDAADAPVRATPTIVASVPPVRTLVGGDRLCASVAAASVLAKVSRDAFMVGAHASHPEYGWEGNKGYGAQAHLDAIRRLGPTPLHRVSWSLPERA